ncbi:HET-domain-containing protein [Tothia fuscella]|uniref:HET-domain-containing protein n=1 Tax=Tothia fuscella TaxID=1048955 RepID=A0A9P4TYU3_9PEZI|nr:HET-domain-containing protein [Tothia fuscella]
MSNQPRGVGLEPPNNLRLHITSPNDAGMQYLTLSHCWGKLEVLKLKSENITSMIAGFRLDEIPKTFHEAVTITRKLGFQYLWIDALCIVQDSPTDWAKEASRMAIVYENSTCTIAAAHGSDSTAGCYVNRQPLQYLPCKLTRTDSMCTDFRQQSEIYAEPPHRCLPSRDVLLGLERQPLHNRAWLVQERTLSPRILYFGSQFMSWEYRDLETPEHHRFDWQVETPFPNVDSPDFDDEFEHPNRILKLLRKAPLAFPDDTMEFHVH